MKSMRASVCKWAHLVNTGLGYVFPEVTRARLERIHRDEMLGGQRSIRDWIGGAVSQVLLNSCPLVHLAHCIDDRVLQVMHEDVNCVQRRQLLLLCNPLGSPCRLALDSETRKCCCSNLPLPIGHNRDGIVGPGTSLRSTPPPRLSDVTHLEQLMRNGAHQV